MPAAATMREAIERLRTEKSPALQELAELERALAEFLRGFEKLSEQAGRVTESIGVLLEAFRPVHEAVHDWTAAGGTGSNGPGGDGSPPDPMLS